MDARELDMWLRQAEAQHLESRMQAMDAARSTWIEGDEFSQVVQEMQDRIQKLRQGVSYEQEVKENWDYLKELGGG